MLLFDTSGVCTAKQIDSFGNFFTGRNDVQKLAFLEGDANLLRLCRMNDFSLIWSINTADQLNDAAFRELGFKEAFEAPKSHDSCRHKESGTLKMWCIQPWVLEENRLRLIKQIKDGNKITDEEINRRMGYPEFRLFMLRKEQTYLDRFGENAAAPRMDDRFPTGLADRRNFFSMISTMTGGFDIAHDPIIVQNITSLTWRTVKERAILYRKGEI